MRFQRDNRPFIRDRRDIRERVVDVRDVRDVRQQGVQGVFRRTGRRAGGANAKKGEGKKGGKSGDDKLDDYWKKDEGLHKLKLDKSLDEYMANAPVANKEGETENKEEAKASE